MPQRGHVGGIGGADCYRGNLRLEKLPLVALVLQCHALNDCIEEGQGGQTSWADMPQDLAACSRCPSVLREVSGSTRTALPARGREVA